MKYYQVSRTAEPKIIGVKTGASQVELLQNQIIQNQDYVDFDNHFSGYNLEFWNTQNKVFELNPPIFEGRMRKNAKQTDLMIYGQQFSFLSELYSERFTEILKAFKIDQFKTFQFNIENIKEPYYLIFYKTITFDEINYRNSIAISGYEVTNNLEYHSIDNKLEYLNLRQNKPFVRFKKISIPEKYSSQDVIDIQASSSLFYSEKLIDFLIDCGITGLQIAYNNSIELEFY